MAFKYCPDCGQRIIEGKAFCANCGEMLPDSARLVDASSETTAGQTDAASEQGGADAGKPNEDAEPMPAGVFLTGQHSGESLVFDGVAYRLTGSSQLLSPLQVLARRAEIRWLDPEEPRRLRRITSSAPSAPRASRSMTPEMLSAPIRPAIVRKRVNWQATTGLVLGLLSMFLTGGSVGLLPILAVVFSGIGLAKSAERGGRMRAWVGLVLGLVGFLAYLNTYGYLR
jgi:hypothetical protein